MVTSRILAFRAAALGLALVLTFALAPPARAQAPSYGYLVQEGAKASVWWAEGAYKVMKSDPLPAAKDPVVRLAAARNEYEPFLLVLRPKTPLGEIRAVMSPLAPVSGPAIPATNISILRVEYVKITTPTDGFGTPGWWPDPLPPLNGPFTAPAGENSSLWITVRVPADARPGIYRGRVSLSARLWSCDIPVELRVWDFGLPERSSIRSSFGLPTFDIRAYHNLETEAELRQVVDLYYANLRDHRLAPSNPFELYPMKTDVEGLPWKGGEFVAEGVHGGKRALKITDDDPARNVEASTRTPVPIAGRTPKRLIFWARTGEDGQSYTVLLEALDAAGEWIPSANLLTIFEGAKRWKRETVNLPRLPSEAESLRLRLFPAFRDNGGTTKGTAWFDDIRLEAAGGEAAGAKDIDILPGGDFETPASAMTVRVDFTEFDKAGRRYLDKFGFNSYNLSLEGLGSGSFYSRKEGVFAGFRQGTPEYDALLSQYLSLVEEHLARNGWLGREYIYWFDEPDPKDYPFVREGMLNIRKNAPRLTRFITEHRPGPAIMDVSEIGCTIFDRVDPEAVAELSAKGREFWSYLCTGPKGPWVTLFIDHPAVNLRIWPWMSYLWKLRGLLVWRADYWNSPTLFPPERRQNPWRDPMSYVVGYGRPYGQVNRWGNGDGRFLYPPNRDPDKDKAKYLVGPVNSVRWEILREGIEDYEYFRLLESEVKAAEGNAGGVGTAGAGAASAARASVSEAARLLDIPVEIFTTGKDYTKAPQDLLRYRRRVAEMIETLAKDQGKR